MSEINLFQSSASGASELSGGDVLLEKSLQNLFEANLEALLAVCFLATEFVTSEVGRMDIFRDQRDQVSGRFGGSEWTRG